MALSMNPCSLMNPATGFTTVTAPSPFGGGMLRRRCIQDITPRARIPRIPGRPPPPPRPEGERRIRRKEFVSGFTLGIALAVAGYEVGPSMRMYPTARDVPERLIRQQGWISGIVETVPDGDGFRLTHTPLVGISLNLPPPFGSLGDPSKRRLSERTISVRLYGVDAPEMGKFGHTNQPFAVKSKKYLESQILGKKVHVQTLSRDQYGRIIGRTKVGMWPFRSDPSEGLLKEGLAEVYRGRGAQYAGNEARLEGYEDTAKRAGKGMWSQGAKRVSPGEYKRAIREEAAAAQVKKTATTAVG
mmetsp:Transcript_10103/g.14059  ORF Transcript_10103/g.14059 Transcript_10103/m.14059 type:complete len:301 (-) Transcript_10103:24-926(-)